MNVIEMQAAKVSPPWMPLHLPSVLIVEDERKMRERLTAQVRALDIEPALAGKGFEAIKMANDLRPELILLDGLLPEMHGFEVARFIRNIDTAYRPFIVMITGIYKGTRYRNEARLKYGIDDFLIKPVAEGELAAIVGRIPKPRPQHWF